MSHRHLPYSLAQGSPQTTVTITGTGLQAGATVSFNDTNITVGTANVVSASTITVPITVGISATIGAHDVTVTNTDGGTDTRTSAFVVGTPPSAPILIDQNGVSGTWCSFPHVFYWNDVTPTDPDPVQYYVELTTDPTFNTITYNSGPTWLTSANWTINLGSSNTTWYWRVRARDSGHVTMLSPWSAPDTFTDGTYYYDQCTCGGGCSCPAFYVWDGTKVAFETDIYAQGVLGRKTSTGFRKPSPNEFYLLENNPQIKDGYYYLDVVEERHEVDYLDSLKLYAIDYPQDRDVYQEILRFSSSVSPETGLHTTTKTSRNLHLLST